MDDFRLVHASELVDGAEECPIKASEPTASDTGFRPLGGILGENIKERVDLPSGLNLSGPTDDY